MKIAYILRTGFGVAGEAASFQYAKNLAGNHEVLVLECLAPNTSEQVVAKCVDVEVVNIHSPKMHDQIGNVYNEIDRFRPDIIHMIQSPYCYHYACNLRKKTPYSKWIIDFRSPHVGDKKYTALKRYFFLQFYVDRVLTHSYASLKTNLPIRLVLADEIPPGVELDLFESQKKASDLMPKKFIFIGSINRTRKLDFLISTFSEFARHKGHDIVLDIYGGGNDSDALQKIIEDKGYERYVKLKGAVPQKELYGIIPQYDVGIAYVPYEFFNTAPSLKSMEYAASKISIIASDTLGHKEYNKRHGFDLKLFSNNRGSFYASLEKAVNTEISGEHIAKNHLAVSQFNWKYIVGEKLVSVYKKITC